MTKSWEKKLFELTRSRSALIKAVVILAGLGMIPAYITFLTPDNQRAQALFEAHFLDEAFGPDAMYFKKAREYPIPLGVLLEFRDGEVPAELKAVVAAFARDVQAAQSTNSVPEHLLALDEQEGRIRFVDRAIGVYWAGRDDEKAARAFEEEGRWDAAHSSRRLAVDYWQMAARPEEVKRLIEDPRYQDVFTPNEFIRYHAARGDWVDVLKWIWPEQHRGVALGVYLLAGLTGLVWLIFIYQASQPKRALSLRLLLCLLAIVSGALSTVPTVFLAILQEQAFNFRMGAELIPGIVYCVAGIGLREEALKLLFFLPFVPVLVKRGNELEMLVVAGCVGLGFAVEENVVYFAAQGAGGGRFLTANFFHIASTGVIGLFCCRMVRQPARTNEFLNMFGVIVVLHGLYDALLIVPGLNRYNYFSLTAFVLLSYLFFGELRHLRGSKRYIISLTSIFLVGLTILVVASFNYEVVKSGELSGTLMNMMNGMLGLGTIIYMYLREIPEQIGE